MRVYSPSAEVQGHGPGPGGAADRQARGRASTALEPVGNYARAAALLATATTPASSPGTTCTSWARSRTSCGSSTRQRLAAAGVDRDAPMAAARPASSCGHSPLNRERRPMSQTHFGFETVDEAREGAARARRLRFGGVEVRPDERPDVARACTAPGRPTRWRWPTCAPGDKVLDIAGGTGDLARAFARQVGAGGTVVHTDINEAMLRAGRDRLLDEGLVLPTLLCDAETAAVSRRAASTSSAWPSACAT